jgi:protocatechuate 3,4-dioxygenase beta subunit
MKRDHIKNAWLVSHFGRREMLGLMGANAFALLAAGCERGQFGLKGLRNLFSQKPQVTAMPPCIVRPEQTEGPYFVDERLNRSDIRSDPSDGSMKAGLLLDLAVRVHEIGDKNCTPLPGALVDIWHCDAHGVYSDVRDRSFDTKGKKFLRGYQITDPSGTAQFKTIYPGWYPGRAVHIHFKVRKDPNSRRGYEFTSQIYFEDALSDQIHANAPYSAKGEGRLRNRQDGIYQEGGDQLILRPTQGQNGYAGTFDIGLNLA